MLVRRLRFSVVIALLLGLALALSVPTTADAAVKPATYKAKVRGGKIVVAVRPGKKSKLRYNVKRSCGRLKGTIRLGKAKRGKRFVAKSKRARVRVTIKRGKAKGKLVLKRRSCKSKVRFTAPAKGTKDWGAAAGTYFGKSDQNLAVSLRVSKQGRVKDIHAELELTCLNLDVESPDWLKTTQRVVAIKPPATTLNKRGHFAVDVEQEGISGDLSIVYGIEGTVNLSKAKASVSGSIYAAGHFDAEGHPDPEGKYLCGSESQEIEPFAFEGVRRLVRPWDYPEPTLP